MAMTILLGRNYRASFDSVIGLKLRTETLAEQLRAEKAVADAARHEAEVANRAKTQFFTAASHDLRQPLHAMGLFAEALRAAHPRARGGAARQQHQRIGRCARGPVLRAARHHPDRQRRRRGATRRTSELGDIFRKLRLHFEPTAFEKGLALRVRGGQHVALADPLLVERIVRNLVSNAIRYTDDGSVAGQLPPARRASSACRSGTPARASAPSERARVFEEFYQVPGTRGGARPSSRRASASAWRSSSGWPS